MNGQQEDSNRSMTITTITEKDKIRLQAAALANDCYKYIMDLTTNGVVITDAIKFVQTNKEKLTMSTKEEKGSKESREPDYDEDEDQDQLEEEQEKETGEVNQEETTNQVFQITYNHLKIRLRYIIRLNMLGDLIYEAKGKITGYRVLDIEGPKIEVTIT